jgi:hypothetical protein
VAEKQRPLRKLRVRPDQPLYATVGKRFLIVSPHSIQLHPSIRKAFTETDIQKAVRKEIKKRKLLGKLLPQFFFTESKGPSGKFLRRTHGLRQAKKTRKNLEDLRTYRQRVAAAFAGKS